MPRFRVRSSVKKGIFVNTASYRELLRKFKGLKREHGKVLHVLGAPGTGKSTNIYMALKEARLNVLDLELQLSGDSLSSGEIYSEFLNSLMDQTTSSSKQEVFKRFSDFDAVLFADRFQDANKFHPENVGFSRWTHRAGFSALRFYILCVRDYLKYRKEFQRANIIFQTVWRIKFRGGKYDAFIDLGLLSFLLVRILGMLFETVEISYSEEETVKIVKKQVDAPESEIKELIKKYGCRPRFICMELEGEFF
jgi:hypothetical protein